MSWSEELVERMRPAYDAVLRHPFLTELAEGTLDPEVFTGYLVQDAHYLRDYGRALAVLAGRAPTLEQTATFARHATGTAEVELELHGGLLAEAGVDVGAAPPSPTTYAYTRHLLATVHGESYATGVAAVLPCYWIYAEVGSHLVAAGSPDPGYTRWIETYAGDDFGAVVREVMALTDDVGRTLGEAERGRAGAAAVTSARYEWMFWDAAHRRERWPAETGA